ncbi:hypothetical protein [Peijinzhouia sedimentorum]
MKNKVISLFNRSNTSQNKEVKYSQLLEKFLKPFVQEFEEVEYYDEIIEFGMNAWNFGNMKMLLPKGVLNEVMTVENAQDIDVDLLKRMIDYKVLHFKEFTNFITDYELTETGGDPILSVITQDQGSYLAMMAESMESEDSDMDFEEGHIDRFAIIVKPLQPFIDWYLNLYPDDPEELEEVMQTRTYLLSDDVENEEAWLRKKFDKIFQLELETFHPNKKEWPQKRNYKMFKDWLRVEISTMIYDCEEYPISKF